MKRQVSNKSKKSTLNLALPVEDKTFLKIWAVEHGTTVSAMIHEYTDELRRSKENEAARK